MKSKDDLQLAIEIRKESNEFSSRPDLEVWQKNKIIKEPWPGRLLLCRAVREARIEQTNAKIVHIRPIIKKQII